jgi:hypothetical protein
VNSINKYLGGIGWGGVAWNSLAHDRAKWGAFVNTVMRNNRVANQLVAS